MKRKEEKKEEKKVIYEKYYKDLEVQHYNQIYNWTNMSWNYNAYFLDARALLLPERVIVLCVYTAHACLFNYKSDYIARVRIINVVFIQILCAICLCHLCYLVFVWFSLCFLVGECKYIFTSRYFFCNLKHVEYVPRRQELRVTRNTEWQWKKGGCMCRWMCFVTCLNYVINFLQILSMHKKGFNLCGWNWCAFHKRQKESWNFWWL